MVLKLLILKQGYNLTAVTRIVCLWECVPLWLYTITLRRKLEHGQYLYAVTLSLLDALGVRNVYYILAFITIIVFFLQNDFKT